eukprot:scaffold24496_cov57-Phaeocystis_antarctica.AAC.2
MVMCIYLVGLGLGWRTDLTERSVADRADRSGCRLARRSIDREQLLTGRGARTGAAGFVGRWVGARFECRPVTSKQQSPAAAAAVPRRGQAEPLRQFTSAMPRDDGGGVPRLRSATGLRGAKQSLEPQEGS